MLILIVGVAQTKAFVLNLTPSTASQRKKRRIAAYPLLTTQGFHSRRLGIATEPAMLAGNRRGFHAVGSHRMAFSGGVGPGGISGARLRGAARRPARSPLPSSASQSETTRRSCSHGV